MILINTNIELSTLKSKNDYILRFFIAIYWILPYNSLNFNFDQIGVAVR